MGNAVIERLQQERAQIEQATSSILDSIEGRDLSRAEMDTVERSRTRIEEIDSQLKPLLDFMESQSASDALTRRISGAVKPAAQRMETRSLGAEFANSEQFQNYRWAGRSGFFEARALPIDLTDIASLLPKPSTVVNVTPPVQSPLLSALRTIPVTQNAIETVVWATVGGAEVVPEKGLKPLIEFVPTVVTKTLDTIAGATQLTRQMMEDAATVAAYINGLLQLEVTKKAEMEAALALSGATITGVTGTDLLKGIRKAVGEIQAAGYNADAVLLNPADWADIDISVTASTMNGPVVGYNFWGLRPIAANSQPPGTATVGDFGSGVQRYIRAGTSVYVTDSHADTFLTNVFTILAETRQKTIVTRPGALREVTVAP